VGRGGGGSCGNHLVSAGVGSQHRGVRAIPGQLQMKERQVGQGAVGESDVAAMRARLEEREQAHFGRAPRDAKLADTRALSDAVDETALTAELTDEERALLAPYVARDKDIEVPADEGPRASKRGRKESDSDDSDDDLMEELAQIRRERDEERRKEAEAAEKRQQEEAEQSAMHSNPLLSLGSDEGGSVRRRWDDDVVFRNQSRGESGSRGRRFINDTIRNDFHKKFMQKYVQ
jgi:protein CWC15